MIRYNIVQYDTMQFDIISYHIILYCTILYNIKMTEWVTFSSRLPHLDMIATYDSLDQYQPNDTNKVRKKRDRERISEISYDIISYHIILHYII